MTSDIPSFVLGSTLALGISTVTESAGIRLERQQNEYGPMLKILGKTGQGLIAVPAIYSLSQTISRLVATKMPELASTFGGSFVRGLAYSGAITFSAIVVLTPIIVDVIKKHTQNQNLIHIVDTVDSAVSFSVRAINMIYLISLAVFSGMSVPIAIGVTISALTVLPIMVDKFL